MTGSGRRGYGMLPAVLLLAAAAGCGTHRPGDATGAGLPSRPPSSGSADFPCPGEDPEPSPPAGATAPAATAAPTDHYAENHGFRVPLPLHGRSRCDGLAVTGRVESALEPLRERGDFSPRHVKDVLDRLGYRTATAYENGPTGVGFLIVFPASPWCVEGTMNRGATSADAFGGYPDGTDCEPPRGGH
ncbi:hypothetical protein [Streptomyces sp. AM 2-1-1]|uniref:hypothetical protein n=1 Tax=Streptomyces sp. AM 2-1-1 TaxID=3028709 RepID=UPI0023B9B0A2|nr:hypothetical protein [Streptomyces sp. AM 2-1-1]WEH38568.1 hypothetical protein PZB77_03090 [Streptomyces sp. AM 2-1-1]